ncbi:MAG: hypothetical protein GC152_13645 [Alphaproteobacteria bacterium]|nr:hypothetical protein [Alphaproteobacteria bacterium]
MRSIRIAQNRRIPVLFVQGLQYFRFHDDFAILFALPEFLQRADKLYQRAAIHSIRKLRFAGRGFIASRVILSIGMLSQRLFGQRYPLGEGRPSLAIGALLANGDNPLLYTIRRRTERRLVIRQLKLQRHFAGRFV